MSELFIITGPAGVGKSTISRRLAERKTKSVLIEGDEIYHHVIGGYKSAWEEGNHLDVFWRVCLKIIQEYLEAGYDVVFNYIIKKEQINKIKDSLNKYKIKFIVLMAKEETLLQRDSLRQEDCQMKERCKILLKRFENNNYNKENILYTDNINVDEIIENIEKDDAFLI